MLVRGNDLWLFGPVAKMPISRVAVAEPVCQVSWQ